MTQLDITRSHLVKDSSTRNNPVKALLKGISLKRVILENDDVSENNIDYPIYTNNPNCPDLNEQQAKALLKASQQRQTITLVIGERQVAIQSTLLGVDLYSYEILLGQCLPRLSPALQESLESEQALLKIKTDDTWLFVQVRLMAELGQGFLCSINSINQTHNQRLSPRLYFDNADAPQLLFQSPKKGLLKGRLCDLSIHGAAIEFLGTDKNGLINRNELHTFVFNFNDYFCPEIRALSVETKFIRNPCRLRVRLRFNTLSENTFSQLYSLVDTLS